MTTIHETNIILNGTKTKIDPNKEYTMTKDGLVETKDPLKEKHFTVKEAAKECGLPVSTIGNAINRGRLLAIQISDSSNWGYHYMIKETDLIDYIDNPKVIRDADKANKVRAYQNDLSKKNYKPKHPTIIPVDANGNPMLTINDIRDRTGRGVCAIRDAMASGYLKAEKAWYGRVLKWFASEADVNSWIENLERNGRIVAEKAEVSKPTDIQKAVIEQKYPTDISFIADQIKKLVDEAYQKGLADGRASVEYDIEEVKKQAKEELLTALKGM